MSTESEITKRVTYDCGEFFITVRVFHGINDMNYINVYLDFIANRTLFTYAKKKGEITINGMTKHFSTNFRSEEDNCLRKGDRKILGECRVVTDENHITVKVMFNAELTVDGRCIRQVFPEDEGLINVRISDDGKISFYTSTCSDECEATDTSRTNTQDEITLDSNSLNMAVMERALHAVGVEIRNEDKTLRKFTDVFVGLIEKWSESAETK